MANTESLKVTEVTCHDKNESGIIEENKKLRVNEAF